MAAAAATGRKVSTVLIVDDHDLARTGLRAILSGEQAISIVGEAATGFQAVEMSWQLKPDVVLMDVHMPGLDGLAATAAIRAGSPDSRVILITTYENPDYLLEALRLRVAGYLMKGATGPEIVNAVRRVLAGERLLTNAAARHILRLLGGAQGKDSPAPVLTVREREVLRLLADGHTNSRIARLLGISTHTVKDHVTRIMEKLGAADRTQAAARAAVLGLLRNAPPPEMA